MDEIISTIKSGKLVPISKVSEICSLCEELLVQENNIHVIPAPVTVCGDIHGQLHDLYTLFEKGGPCPSTRYLFLGDFVDRGFHSVETLLLLLCLKVKYPDRMFLVRGNHESRQITASYGFYDECLRKYGNALVWRMCCELFDHLALGALIGGPGGVFCVHGGLSPDAEDLNQIKILDRKQEVPHQGVMCDLLWSDPEEKIDKYSNEDWALSSRGAGFLFGYNPVQRFHHTNNTSLIARAHQLVQEGYNEMFDNQLVTVWSAPNYCYRCGNKASVLCLDEDLNRSYKLFDATDHPDIQALIGPNQRIPDYFL